MSAEEEVGGAYCLFCFCYKDSTMLHAII